MSTPVTPPTLSELEFLLSGYCQSHGISRLEVFGSVARGEAEPGSDFDLLVTFRPEIHLGLDFFGMQAELVIS